MGMKTQPLISVIVPVYKVEAYLDQCIQSVVGQTYEKWELILVDDGSPDRSGSICDEWAAKDSRIHVIHKENGGAGMARNVALDASKGELIAFVDSDDYIAPEMFQHLLGLLAENVDIVECAYVETKDNSVAFTISEEPVVSYTPQEAMREHIRDTVFRQLIWNKLYRRAVVGNIRFPVGKKIDDEFFTYQVLGNARQLVLCRSTLYAYRQQESSVMHQSYSLNRLDGIEAKLQRLSFICSQMPELESEAKIDLIMSCLFAMQNALRFLKDEELEQAKAIIHHAMHVSKISGWNREISVKKNILIGLAQWNLAGVSRCLNWLMDIRVLT